MDCPLCHSPDHRLFFEDQQRPYRRCNSCELVFVSESHRLDRAAEKRVYDQHENDPADPQYREFLSRLYRPMIARVPEGAEGLDFGAGPGPTLSVMFEEVGHNMWIYDPFYAPQAAALQRTYDFITASEVVEHLYRPGEELARLWACLRPGGWLGVMTKRVRDREPFASWHYKNDPTHVCFYSEATFRWIAGNFGARLEFAGEEVALLEKTTGK